MTDVDVDRIIRRTLKHEGGFQKKENDPGNWTGGKVGVGVLRGTKFGISAKSYPETDIENLTEEQAVMIYRLDYSSPMMIRHLDSIRVGFKVFDIGVNRGPHNGVRTLQRSLGVIVDGKMGWETLNAANKSDPLVILDRMVNDLIEQYEEIVERNPSMRDWFPIWIKRAQDTGEGLEPIDRTQTPKTVA